MLTTTTKKKLVGKKQKTLSKPFSTKSTFLVQLGDRTTSEATSLAAAFKETSRSLASKKLDADTRSQLNQQVADALGIPVQLSDS